MLRLVHAPGLQELGKGHTRAGDFDENLLRAGARALHLGEFNIVGTGQSGDANGFHDVLTVVVGPATDGRLTAAMDQSLSHPLR